MKHNIFIIDGNNVALTPNRKIGDFSLLLKVKKQLSSFGVVHLVVSHELVYRINKPKKLKRLIIERQILATPPNTDADRFILEIAKQLNAYIVSNDQFRQYKRDYSDTIRRRIPFMVFYDHQGVLRVILPQLNEFKVQSYDKKPFFTTGTKINQERTSTISKGNGTPVT